MTPLLSAVTLFLLYTASYASCWQYFTSLSDIALEGSAKSQEHLHSVYKYGDCTKEGIRFYDHVHLDHMDVLGKIIIRGWIKVMRIPTCIILRATANEEDQFRSTSFPFQICVPRITYCHTQRRFKYFFYEWYIPKNYIGGMNWDILFYGPPNLEW